MDGGGREGKIVPEATYPKSIQPLPPSLMSEKMCPTAKSSSLRTPSLLPVLLLSLFFHFPCPVTGYTWPSIEASSPEECDPGKKETFDATAFKCFSCGRDARPTSNGDRSGSRIK